MGFHPPHFAGLYHHHPFWSNLSDFDLLFRLWVSAERKFSINHCDVCFKSEWACLWLEFLSCLGMASSGWMRVSYRRACALTLVSRSLLIKFSQKHGRQCEMFNFGFNYSSNAYPVDMCPFYCTFTSSIRCTGLISQGCCGIFQMEKFPQTLSRKIILNTQLHMVPFSKRLVLHSIKIRHTDSAQN